MTDSEIAGLKEQHAKLLHISEHLANERTILAWIRTALAIMALGVGLNRFSLFLLEVGPLGRGGRTTNVHAEEVGVGLILLGLVMMVGATFHYLNVARAIDDNSYKPSRPIIVAAALAVVLLGGVSLVWLM